MTSWSFVRNDERPHLSQLAACDARISSLTLHARTACDMPRMARTSQRDVICLHLSDKSFAVVQEFDSRASTTSSAANHIAEERFFMSPAQLFGNYFLVGKQDVME